MFIEEWRDIKGYEGLYQVSNLGKVRSLDRYRKQKGNSIAFIKGRILKHTVCSTTGYCMVALYKDKGIKMCTIHRLVAKAFLPNPGNLPQVNHKNECKWDNTVWNLEWCTREYNCKYGTAIERMTNTLTGRKLTNEHKLNISKARKGVYNTNNSKKVYQLTLNNELVKEWPSTMEIQRTLCFDNTNISRCCRGKRESYKGFKWSYSID